MFMSHAAAASQAHNTIIKQIVNFEITIPAAATSATYSISVDSLDKCLLIPRGMRIAAGATNSRDGWQPVLQLSNTTTITATTQSTASGAERYIAGTLIEFMPFAVKQSYQSSFSLSSGETSDTDTIPPVNAALTAIMHLGQITDNTSQNISRSQSRIRLTSSETVSINREEGVGFITAVYQVIEFSEVAIGGATALITIPGNQTSRTTGWTYASGAAIPTNFTRAMFFWQGFTGTGFQSNSPMAYSLSDFSPTAERNTANADPCFMLVGVMGFREKWVDEYDGNTGFSRIPSAGASKNDVTAYDGPKMVACHMGQTTDNTASNIDRFLSTVELINDNTEIEVVREAAAATYVDVSVQYTLFR